MVGMRNGMGALRAEVQATNARLDRLHDDVLDLHADLVGVNGRLDVLTERVDKLDATVEKVGDHMGGVVLDLHDRAALSTGRLIPVKNPALSKVGLTMGHEILEHDKGTNGVSLTTIEECMTEKGQYIKPVSCGPLPRG
jgi:hypothetical protein